MDDRRDSLALHEGPLRGGALAPRGVPDESCTAQVPVFPEPFHEVYGMDIGADIVGKRSGDPREPPAVP